MRDAGIVRHEARARAQGTGGVHARYEARGVCGAWWSSATMRGARHRGHMAQGGSVPFGRTDALIGALPFGYAWRGL
jgi:hypothetical protein